MNANSHVPSKKTVFRLSIMTAAGSFLLFVVAGLIAYNTLFGAAERGTALAEQLDQECNRVVVDRTIRPLCDNADRVISEAPDTVIQIQGPRGRDGKDGEDGPPPSPEAVSAAVTAYCETNNCRGPQGDNASQTQVALAVASYCNDRGQCAGPQGQAGSDGQDGATGDTGGRGPGPTMDQIEAAVAAFCGGGSCRGADGEDGEDGPMGPQGPIGPRGVEGAQGEPGPTCPEGFTGQEFTVETGESPVNNDMQAVFACVPN